MEDAAQPASAADVTRRAADAICSALFRCCDDDLVDYFAPYRENMLLEQFKPQLPPDATLDENGCRAVLKPMLEIVPLGDWVEQANDGSVTFDEPAFDACIAALDNATCGAEVRAALWDSTCLGFAPPAGGQARRSFFHRTRTAGATCKPIRDGIGAAFYGSCDPGQAFCCYEVPGRQGCQYPYDADGNARTGTCASTAAVGQTCSPSAPVQLCATGNDCDAETLRCVGANDAPLAVGATCVDDSYHLLGQCTDSYCDLFGTKRCEARHANGETCSADEQCESNRCSTTCVEMDLCTGEPSMEDPPTPPPPSSGETCTSAIDLASVSVSSPVMGFAHRVTGTFGAANDYNPLGSSGMPPSCAYVYDANGNDRVYALTLQPGQTLRLRLELADGKQAGLYLLDSCPAGSWPDFDMTGACGSNEYNAGFCGPIGCDPAALTIAYPTTSGTQPNVAATFWVVVDQIAGTDSSGFSLDWNLD